MPMMFAKNARWHSYWSELYAPLDSSRRFCRAGRPMVDRTLEYAEMCTRRVLLDDTQSPDLGGNGPNLLTVVKLDEAHIADIRRVNQVDDRLYAFLRGTMDDIDGIEARAKPGASAGTLIVLISDHGTNHPPYSTTPNGPAERMLPTLITIASPALRRARPDVDAGLHRNRQQLVSMFDVRESLYDLAPPIGLKEQQQEPTKGTAAPLWSEKIAQPRSCKSVGVPGHSCMCLTWDSVAADDATVVRLVTAAIANINDVLDQKAGSRPTCAVLSLKRIEHANVAHEPERDMTHARITFVVEPDDAEFEVVGNRKATSGDFEVDFVRRLSWYSMYRACTPKDVPVDKCICPMNHMLGFLPSLLSPDDPAGAERVWVAIVSNLSTAIDMPVSSRTQLAITIVSVVVALIGFVARRCMRSSSSSYASSAVEYISLQRLKRDEDEKDDDTADMEEQLEQQQQRQRQQRQQRQQQRKQQAPSLTWAWAWASMAFVLFQLNHARLFTMRVEWVSMYQADSVFGSQLFHVFVAFAICGLLVLQRLSLFGIVRVSATGCFMCIFGVLSTFGWVSRLHRGLWLSLWSAMHAFAIVARISTVLWAIVRGQSARLLAVAALCTPLVVLFMGVVEMLVGPASSAVVMLSAAVLCLAFFVAAMLLCDAEDADDASDTRALVNMFKTTAVASLTAAVRRSRERVAVLRWAGSVVCSEAVLWFTFFMWPVALNHNDQGTVSYSLTLLCQCAMVLGSLSLVSLLSSARVALMRRLIKVVLVVAFAVWALLPVYAVTVVCCFVQCASVAVRWDCRGYDAAKSGGSGNVDDGCSVVPALVCSAFLLFTASLSFFMVALAAASSHVYTTSSWVWVVLYAASAVLQY
eukprot:TRINITY_DN67474_c3_g9_i1.p1 TRINITY_DN67474_c3_g9~~TRINITY_DN67474_c3_g9_i1.p1  ORF type:complete len:895 (+),score=328.11 TRINITY_DN67474_c3_g9_i1:88-2685(+)